MYREDLALQEQGQQGLELYNDNNRGLDKYTDQGFKRDAFYGGEPFRSKRTNIDAGRDLANDGYFSLPDSYKYRSDGNDNRYFSKTTEDRDDDHTRIIDDNDLMYLKYLSELHSSLTGERLDLNRFNSALEALEAVKKAGEMDYLKALLNPERHRNAKIPTSIPIPTASFQLRSSFYVNLNAAGNAAIAINPFWLTTGGNSTVFVNNNGSLTGMGPSNFFNAISAGQTLPNAIYNQYRLVSGSVICKYVGRLDIVQGIIGGAIAYDKGIVPTPVGTTLPALARWGDFNLARDAMYRQEHYSLSGLREIYFPIDNSFEEFQSLNSGKDGFMFFIYFQNGPPSTGSFKIDMFFNFECLPDVEFLNYIPTDVCKASPVLKDAAIRNAKENAITKESANPVVNENNKTGVKSLVEKVGNSIGAVKGWGKAIEKIVSDGKSVYDSGKNIMKLLGVV